MTELEIQKLVEGLAPKLEKVVEKKVNGKIDHLHVKLDTYIKEDTEWKARAEPVIQMGNNVRGFGKVSLYIVGFVAAVAGAIISFTNLFNNK